jgi:ABC-type transport system substrate-binding protein/DNA-binding SARP family transcriptional activator
MDYRLLGPIEVGVNGHTLDLGGLKQRTLLAILLLRANEPVPRDVLVGQLWGERPPLGAQHTLEVYISRLRKVLEQAADGQLLTTRPGAYLLQVAADELDTHRFEWLARAGRQTLAAGATRQAADQFSEALALWRGAPLADLRYKPFAQLEIARLEELRIGVVEDRIDADLALGRHADVVSEVESLVATHPLRERLRQQLMIALYRCGRQADALSAYQAARRVLVEELGIEPGPALQQLQRAVLAQDASLDPPARAAAGTAVPGTTGRWLAGRIRRPWLLTAAGAVLVLMLALLLAGPLNPSGGSASLTAGPDTVGIIDGGRGVVSTLVTGVGRPNGVAYGAGSVWVTDGSDDLLLRVDRAGQVVDRIPVGRDPTGVAFGAGEVWVANDLDGTVSEVNPAAGTVVSLIQVGNGPGPVAFGYGSVWVANVTDGTLVRINPGSGQITATVPLGSAPAGLAAGAHAIWVTSPQSGLLLRVGPDAGRVTRAYPVGGSPSGVAVGAGSVWIADLGGTVARLDPVTGRVRKIKAGGTPTGVTYADGAVWVASGPDGGITRIDPRTGATRPIHTGNEPTALAAAGGRVLVTVLPSLASHRGGTLTLIGQVSRYNGSADPAVAYALPTWQMLSITNDGLVGYRRVGGSAGDTLVPDLATALPTPTDGGTTYTFHLRAGLTYSNGAPVRPEDFRRAIERVFAINQGGAQGYYTGIVGGQACERVPSRCDLARGIVANDQADTVTFHLTAPDPEFLYKLAFPFADAVPARTPDRPVGPTQLPATGPYMTRSFVPLHSWTLVRNPRFRQWSSQAQPGGYPDRIVLRMNVAPAAAVDAIEHGRADVLITPPPGSIQQLATRYPAQLHTGPMGATIALVLNTRVRPFSVPAARQALNYAIDRNTMVDFAGGPLTAQPTCQILPPAMVGYQPFCPYTINPSPSGAWTAPNLARAQQLVHVSGTAGTKVTVLTGDSDATGADIPERPTGHYLVSVLDRLGYRASLRVISDPVTYVRQLYDSRRHAQIGWFSWYEDFPAPSDFIGTLLTCRSFVPASQANLNAAEFCDPRIDAQVTQALALETRLPNAAGALWARIDRELTEQAPWVPLYNPRALVMLSARVGNYQFHPYWTVLVDQLWVR